MKEPIGLESLSLDRDSQESLGAQLVRRLRAAVETGILPAPSRVLPSRELARRLGVSRNTVTFALDQLVAEGYLETRAGAGTFVSPTFHPARKRQPQALRTPPRSARDLDALSAKLDGVGSSYGPLRVGAPDLSAFPTTTWERLARRNLPVGAADLDYGQSSGVLELRQAISRHIAQFRGVVADPDQIFVVEGAQAALHLIAFVMTRRGETVAIEDPCYQLAGTLFAAHGLILEGVAVDACGMQTTGLPAGAALAYVTPSHQFPLGGAMPIVRRRELLDWARRSDAYIVEDDYDSEFDLHPVPALQSLDRDGRVIYVGTFSKTLSPGLRCGYVVAPRHLAQTFGFARAITCHGAPAQLQKTIADFILQGHFSRHVRRMSATYERRRRIVGDVFSAQLPPGFSAGPAQTGLHVAILGPRDFDDVRAANSLPKGNRILPISLLCVARTDCRGLLLGFSAGSDESVGRAAELLAGVLRSATA